MLGFRRARVSGPSTSPEPGFPVHLFLTDRLACPRCGPDFGLILLARKTMDRRVYDGDLGCPNCRDQFPVRDGFADLRPPPRTSDQGGGWPAPESEGGGDASSQEEALRMAATMGVTEGPGTLLVIGPAARFAGGVSRLIGGVEVVGIHPALEGVEEEEGVSRIRARGILPFMPASFRGVLLSGGVENPLLAEAFRVVSPGGRVVIFDPRPENVSWVEEAGATILLREAGVLVARQEEVDTQPLVTLRGL